MRRAGASRPRPATRAAIGKPRRCARSLAPHQWPPGSFANVLPLCCLHSWPSPCCNAQFPPGAGLLRHSLEGSGQPLKLFQDTAASNQVPTRRTRRHIAIGIHSSRLVLPKPTSSPSLSATKQSLSVCLRSLKPRPSSQLSSLLCNTKPIHSRVVTPIRASRLHESLAWI